VENIVDPQAYLGQELSKASQGDPQIKGLIVQSEQEVVAPLLQNLGAAGYAI